MDASKSPIPGPEGSEATQVEVALILQSALVPREVYLRPLIEPLGHWQVHTMDTYSIPVLP